MRGIRRSSTRGISPLAATSTKIAWKASSSARAVSTRLSFSASPKRRLADSMALKSFSVRCGTASSAASAWTAATTGNASRVSRRWIGATCVKRCGAVSTSPSCSSRFSASRTGVRLSPSHAHSSWSRSRSPGASVPSTIASRIVEYARSRSRSRSSGMASGTGI